MQPIELNRPFSKIAPIEGGLENWGYRLFCCVRAETLNNQKCRIIVVSPSAILPRRRTKTFDFIVLLRKKSKKRCGLAKFAETKENIFTVTSNTRVCSRHFREEDYTISEDGKGKKDCLEKRCCAFSVSVNCHKAISEYFSKQRQAQRWNFGGTT